MLDSQKYSNIYKNSFSLKEKIILNDNFKIDNKTLKKRNNKFCLSAYDVLGKNYEKFILLIAIKKLHDDCKDIIKKGE